MFDKFVRLIALALLAVFVYSHARQAEVGRFQMRSTEGIPVLVDTRAGRVYTVMGGRGARLLGDANAPGMSSVQPAGEAQASPLSH